MILRLENEMSMLEAKERALIDEEEDFLNDNIIQVELCEDKIPQFESIFKDPNDFPYLSSLTKIEDDKIPSNEKISLKEIQQVLGEGAYLSEIEFRKNEYYYLLIDI